MNTTQTTTAPGNERYAVRGSVNGEMVTIARSNDCYEINAAFDKIVHSYKYDPACGRGLPTHNYDRLIVRDRVEKRNLAWWVR